MESRNRTGRRPSLPVALFVALFAVGCGEATPQAAQTIPTEAFVDAMVALRTSPVLGTSGFLPAGEPERILSERGLTPEDLRSFVEVHGANVDMMTDVWTEIESRVAEARGVTEPGN
jgi:hypothetical protein